MEKHARFNLDSRWHLWKDDWEDVRGERVGKISRKIERFERKFVKILKGLADSPDNDLTRHISKQDYKADDMQRVEYFKGRKQTDSIAVKLTPTKNTDEPSVDFDTMKAILAKQKPEFLRELNSVEVTLSDLVGEPGGIHVDGGYYRNFITLTTKNTLLIENEKTLNQAIEHSFDHELGHHVRQLMEYAKHRIIDDEKFRELCLEYDDLFDKSRVKTLQKYGIIEDNLSKTEDRMSSAEIVKEEVFANLFRAYKQQDWVAFRKVIKGTDINFGESYGFFRKLFGE